MKKVILVLISVVVLWALWSYIGRSHAWKESNLAIDVKEVIVSDSICKRNVVGIQPYMFPEDYQSEKHFFEKINGYFQEAQWAGYFNENTVVLLPEYLGTWLVINHEKSGVAEATTMQSAMTLMVMSNPLKFIKHYGENNNEADPLAATIFRMKAESMASIYSRVFKDLAKRYQITINGGSIILPGPSVDNNEIIVDTSAPLYNTSFFFKPDGGVNTQLIKKSFPIHSELSFIQAAPLDELPLFDLPIGKTALLVCADSWYPQSYNRANELGADIILVPSYCTGDATMSKKWNGYDGLKRPDDVDTLDIRKLSENEAWIKYALPGRIKQSRASIGVNVFLRGELWDLGSDGQPFFVSNGTLKKISSANRAGIWNFCF